MYYSRMPKVFPIQTLNIGKISHCLKISDRFLKQKNQYNRKSAFTNIANFGHWFIDGAFILNKFRNLYV